MKIKFTAILLVIGALLFTAGSALADQAAGGKKMNGWSLRWKATSPAIHKGDQYTLDMNNTSNETQNAQVHTEIMDHRNHTNTDVVNEQVELAPGEEREFTATNDYGDANHFNTIVGSETQDFDLAVKVTDPAGEETARFNQKAFLIDEGKAKGADKDKGAKAQGHAHNGHAQEEGFATLVPTALRDTARLTPLSLGVLAATGFGFYAFRRRWAWAGPSGGLAGPGAVLSPVWRAAAAGGLALSAVLHFGLAPAHFAEAPTHGIFFYAAGAVLAVIAAAILAWPSRAVYLAGAGVSLPLILLWALFRIIPPPGAEAPETVELVGLFTKTTELVAATACIVLWFRDRRAPRL